MLKLFQLSYIFLLSLAMTMAIPVAKRVRDVFYKHRASGMIGHTAVFVGMTTAELPYLLSISILYVFIYCATVSVSLKFESSHTYILILLFCVFRYLHHDRLVSSQP